MSPDERMARTEGSSAGPGSSGEGPPYRESPSILCDPVLTVNHSFRAPEKGGSECAVTIDRASSENPGPGIEVRTPTNRAWSRPLIRQPERLQPFLTFYGPCDTSRARRRIHQADVATPSEEQCPAHIPGKRCAPLSSLLLALDAVQQNPRPNAKKQRTRGAFFLRAYRLGLSFSLAISPRGGRRNGNDERHALTDSDQPVGKSDRREAQEKGGGPYAH